MHRTQGPPRVPAEVKVYLDDFPPDSDRVCPPGWVAVTTPEQAIQLLAQGQVTLISLDHDLALPEPRNGYMVVKWIEEQVIVHGFKPPEIRIHSANSVGVQNMLRGIESILRHSGGA